MRTLWCKNQENPSDRISHAWAPLMYASVPYLHDQHVLKGTFQIWNFYAYTEHTCKKLMLMLRVRISSWCVCSANATCLTRMPGVRISSSCVCSACFEGTALCARISTWRVCSVHAPVPDSYAQRSHQFLTCMLSARISSWHVCSLLSVHISS